MTRAYAAASQGAAPSPIPWLNLPRFLVDLLKDISISRATPWTDEGATSATEVAGGTASMTIDDPLKRPEEIRMLPVASILALINANNLDRRVPELAVGSQAQLKRLQLIDSRNRLTKNGVSAAEAGLDWMQDNPEANKYIASAESIVDSLLESLIDGDASLGES